MGKAVALIANLALFAFALLVNAWLVFYLAWATAYWVEHSSVGNVIVCGLLTLAIPFVVLLTWAWTRQRHDPPMVAGVLVASFSLVAAFGLVLVSLAASALIL